MMSVPPLVVAFLFLPRKVMVMSKEEKVKRAEFEKTAENRNRSRVGTHTVRGVSYPKSAFTDAHVSELELSEGYNSPYDETDLEDWEPCVDVSVRDKSAPGRQFSFVLKSDDLRAIELLFRQSIESKGRDLGVERGEAE